MPYKSEKQRKYLHSQKPEVAKRFDAEIRKGKPAGKKVVKRKATKKK